MQPNSLTSLIIKELFTAFETIPGFSEADAYDSMLAYRNYFAALAEQRQPVETTISSQADTFLDQLEAAITTREELELDAVVVGTDFPTLNHYYQSAFDELLSKANLFSEDEQYWEALAYEIGAVIGSYDRKWLRETTGIRITPNDVRPTPPMPMSPLEVLDFDPVGFDQELLLLDKQYPNHPVICNQLVLNADNPDLAARAKKYLKPLTAYPPGKLGFYQDEELVDNWLAHVRFLLSEDRVNEALPYTEQLFRLGYTGSLTSLLLSSLELEGVRVTPALRKQYPLTAERLGEPPADDLMDILNELTSIIASPEGAAGVMEVLGLSAPQPSGRRRKPSAKVRSLKSKRSTQEIYRIKITLRGSKPPIWRRVELRTDTQLEELHAIIQTVFEWDNSHLHSFNTGGRFRQSLSSPDDPFGLEYGESYAGITINEMFARSGGKKFTYTYDFGDSWEHIIQLEKELPINPKVNYPVCITGRRAAPLDDTGGLWGFYDYLEAIRDPEHELHEDAIEWLGEDFDPKAFDVQEINGRLEAFR